MHIKRQVIKKFWPVPRKGTVFLSVVTHNKTDGVPLMTIMRDVLKLVRTRKELKKLINGKKIQINGKTIRETNYPLMLFDVLSLPSIKKNYVAVLKSKKMHLEELPEKDAGSRTYKVLGKTPLKSKKIQINLSNGKNVISSEKIKVGDFVLISNSHNKIIKIAPIEKGSQVNIVKGKHVGKEGKINSIVKEGENNVAEIETKDKDKIRVKVEDLFMRL